jgi:hypothetical protein
VKDKFSRNNILKVDKSKSFARGLNEISKLLRSRETGIRLSGSALGHFKSQARQEHPLGQVSQNISSSP